MGRHSAPDQEEPDDESATLTLVRDAGPATGRHAIDDDEQATVVIEPAEADVAAEPAVEEAPAEPERPAEEAAPKPDKSAAKAAVKAAKAETKAADKQARREQKVAAKAARGESNTRADLRMLRQNRAVRLQCLLVVVIAFGAYTAVMLGLSHTGDTYLRWIWIPIVLSGVLVGACLDLAHRRATRKAEPAERAEPAEPADPEA
jgi:type IV secretory pathway VirB10-like protein